jgi:Mig-14
LVGRCWTTISAEEYQGAFARFGGSFAVHPRVVALVASLAKRPVRYAGLAHQGELVAAVPLWGRHVVASKPALKFYGQSHLIDVGHSEVVLPIAENARVNVPFRVKRLSCLHVDNITNIELEPDRKLTLAKGLQTGEHRLSAKSKAKRRREMRRFQDIGGRCQPISQLSVEEIATSYTRLFEKRWGFSPLGKELLSVVLRELKDMLCGSMLLVGDRPVALHLIYRHETPRFLFANFVNQANDQEFCDYTPGSILTFRNLEHLEEEAIASNKPLRFSFGLNEEYKALWCYEVPTYDLRRLAGIVRNAVAAVRCSLRDFVLNAVLFSARDKDRSR